MPAILESRNFIANEPLQKRDTPKIGGSEGGFIAVVVCLVLIILVSCSGIYYLLRYYEPSEYERKMRRSKSQQAKRWYQPHGLPSASREYHYGASATSGGPRSIFSKLGGVFSAGWKSDGRGGWAQAGLEDVWETASLDEPTVLERPAGSTPKKSSAGAVSVAPAYRRENSNGSSSSSVMDEPFSPPMVATYVGEDGTRFGVTPRTSLPSRYSPPPSIARPSAATMAPAANVPRTGSPEQMPRGQGLTSPGSEPGNAAGRKVSFDRQERTQSGSSARTFSGGTKFLEAL